MRIITTSGGPQDDGLAPIERILLRLEHYRPTGERKWMACCPAHLDRTPSLSLRELDDGKALIHCFAGCDPMDVLEAIGLRPRDLFPDDPTWAPKRATNGNAPKRDVADARFTLEIVRAACEVGELTEEGRRQAREAIAVLLRAGITPEWAPPEPEKPAFPLPVPQPEFVATQFPPEEPILGPFRSQQLALIYAPTGAGKTMFALGMAAAMALGQDFLRWPSRGPRRVLYVDGEMSAWELQRRLGGVQAPNLYLASSMAMSTVHGIEPLNLAMPEGQAVLLEWVRALAIEVVYLDNLMCLSYVPGTSINSDESWRPVNQLCLTLRAAGLLVVILDHANQTGHIHGTKTKLWHVNHGISITAIDDDEPDAFEAFSGRVSVGTKPRLRVIWEKERGTKEKAENGGTLTDEFVATIGDVGTTWDVEIGDAAMKRRAVEMKENGMNIREIADELMVSKSKVGRWTRGIK